MERAGDSQMYYSINNSIFKSYILGWFSNVNIFLKIMIDIDNVSNNQKEIWWGFQVYKTNQQKKDKHRMHQLQETIDSQILTPNPHLQNIK
ncbi:hypothetical protein TTHERM_01328970 (macronuclear) [Tetrahymena thermophila SB210]|uniref:Uncharacterized protein n=1 Tax=Tetrahymena thermophila (strain SB210) TaxID=312017 RepID=Q23CQ6_TETTS|nr:hypothetical protein TTHERM_01328970 [Tetrahymena thermophila SB210]EAR94319.1 hypothetical protein TTHERM_01328970 [Tetrahymena thermophila SB210]|eukprot:XP_001014564.1 hypothetical protein TTHERM_01328970 [Tetrahymena thermophila SB210]